MDTSLLNAFLWIAGSVVVIFSCSIQGLLSDYKICRDPECESPLSRVQAIREYRSKDCRFLSFRRGDAIIVYHKLTGERGDLWAGSIDKQFGYFPKDAVKEEQVYATATTEVKTQESDFFCMDESGSPVDTTHLDFDDNQDEEIQKQESGSFPSDAHLNMGDQPSEDSTTAGDFPVESPAQSEKTGEERKTMNDAGPPKEEEPSPQSSSWFSSSVTGWFGRAEEKRQEDLVEEKSKDEREADTSLASSMTGWFGRVKEEPLVEAEDQDKTKEGTSLASSVTGWFGRAKEEPTVEAEDQDKTKAEPSLASSVTGWLNFGGDAKKDVADESVTKTDSTAGKLASTMSGWLGLGGEQKTDSDPNEVRDGETDEGSEPDETFRSRRMSLDLEGSQLHEEEKAETGTFNWLGSKLSSGMGFGRTQQGPQGEAEKTEEKQESGSWLDVGIGGILGYRKENDRSRTEETEDEATKEMDDTTKGGESTNGSLQTDDAKGDISNTAQVEDFLSDQAAPQENDIKVRSDDFDRSSIKKNVEMTDIQEVSSKDDEIDLKPDSIASLPVTQFEVEPTTVAGDEEDSKHVQPDEKLAQEDNLNIENLRREDTNGPEKQMSQSSYEDKDVVTSSHQNLESEKYPGPSQLDSAGLSKGERDSQEETQQELEDNNAKHSDNQNGDEYTNVTVGETFVPLRESVNEETSLDDDAGGRQHRPFSQEPPEPISADVELTAVAETISDGVNDDKPHVESQPEESTHTEAMQADDGRIKDFEPSPSSEINGGLHGDTVESNERTDFSNDATSSASKEPDEETDMKTNDREDVGNEPTAKNEDVLLDVSSETTPTEEKEDAGVMRDEQEQHDHMIHSEENDTQQEVDEVKKEEEGLKEEETDGKKEEEGLEEEAKDGKKEEEGLEEEENDGKKKDEGVKEEVEEQTNQVNQDEEQHVDKLKYNEIPAVQGLNEESAEKMKENEEEEMEEKEKMNKVNNLSFSENISKHESYETQNGTEQKDDDNLGEELKDETLQESDQRTEVQDMTPVKADNPECLNCPESSSEDDVGEEHLSGLEEEKDSTEDGVRWVEERDDVTHTTEAYVTGGDESGLQTSESSDEAKELSEEHHNKVESPEQVAHESDGFIETLSQSEATGDITGETFGLFKKAINFWRQEPVAEPKEASEATGSREMPEILMHPHQEATTSSSIEQHAHTSPPADSLHPPPTEGIPQTSPLATEAPAQSETLTKLFKNLSVHINEDEMTILMEIFGQLKLEFLDYVLDSAQVKAEDSDVDRSVLSDIEGLLHQHKELLIFATTMDAKTEEARTLVALQKIERLLNTVKETFNMEVSDSDKTTCHGTLCSEEFTEKKFDTQDSPPDKKNNFPTEEEIEAETSIGTEGESKYDEAGRKDSHEDTESLLASQHQDGITRHILNVIYHVSSGSINCAQATRGGVLWLTLQVVSALPEDIRPGPDLYGVPWEPVIITGLVGLVTVLLFTCRCYTSVKSRINRSRERCLAEEIAQLLNEKCKVLETLSQCQQEYDDLEVSLSDSGVLAQTQKAEHLEVRAKQLKNAKTEQERDLEELRNQLSLQREHRKDQERRIAILEESMKSFEDEAKELQSQDEQAQTTLKVYNMNSERLQRNLEIAEEENKLLQETNSHFRQEVEEWAERVSEIEEEMQRCEIAHSGMLQDVANRDERIKALTDQLLKMKAWDSDLEEDEREGSPSKGVKKGSEGSTDLQLQKVQKLIYAAKLNADLKSVDEDKDRVFAKLNDEVKAKEDLQESIKELEHERLSLHTDSTLYSEQVERLQQKLQIMTEMYQENELKLHRMLTVEEKDRLQKEEKLSKADKNIAMAMEELHNYRQRAEEMEEELEKARQSYQTQISAHERKAHNNWLAARGAERELSDIRRENALLRQKLTDTQFKLDTLDKDPYTLNSLARPLPFRAERSYGPSPLGRASSENRPFLSPPTLMDGPPARLSPRDGHGELEHSGGPHSDSGSISPTWDRDRRGPAQRPSPGPPGPLGPYPGPPGLPGHPGHMFPEPGGPMLRRHPAPPPPLGMLPPPGPLPLRGPPPGPPHPLDMAGVLLSQSSSLAKSPKNVARDGSFRDGSFGPGEQERRMSGPGERRTPPESDPRMGGPPLPPPPHGLPLGPMDGPFPRRAPGPYGPPVDFYPPRLPGGPPMRPMWAPPPSGMMFPPRYPPGGPPYPPPPPLHRPPAGPPPSDSFPPSSSSSSHSGQHGQPQEDGRPSPEDVI